MNKLGGNLDDEDRFHDSLDRLLSSSNTSCSCSSSDDDYDEGDVLYRSGLASPDPGPPIPRFPKGVSNNYDIWISQPFSSVEERRLNLLRQMGLSQDPALLRHRPSLSFSVATAHTLRPDLFSRSASSDRLNNVNIGEIVYDDNKRIPNVSAEISACDVSCSNSCDVSNSGVQGIIRSKSHGQRNSTLKKKSEIPSSHLARPICNGGSTVVNNYEKIDCQTRNDELGVLESATEDGSPIGKYRSGSSRNASSSGLPFSGNGEEAENLEGNVTVKEEGPVCLIKDLDNGKEFVVNEVKEDGSWNRLKEVGTGRQLTMEEFEKSVGTSPIVQELMRRQNVEEGNRNSTDSNADGSGGSVSHSKKKGSWLKSIKNVASSVTGYKDKRSSDDRDTSSEKGGRRSSSATDDSQDVSFHGPERVRVRQYGKSVKELTALYRNQEIQAHNGSIWSIKFSVDGKYLASAGEDSVIHVWQVVESERKGDLLFDKPEDGNLNLLFLTNGSPELTSMSPSFDEKRRKGRSSISRKSVSLEHILVPETVFALSDKPFCSFKGHMDDVLDLSWSKSQVSTD